jgi:hypothetical protein
VLNADEVAGLSTNPAVLADGLRLGNHFHALGLGLQRSAVLAGAAWLITGIAHEVRNSPDLNPDGHTRLHIARSLLAILDVQLQAIEALDTAAWDRIEQLAGSTEIAAPVSIGLSGERANAS